MGGSSLNDYDEITRPWAQDPKVCIRSEPHYSTVQNAENKVRCMLALWAQSDMFGLVSLQTAACESKMSGRRFPGTRFSLLIYSSQILYCKQARRVSSPHGSWLSWFKPHLYGCPSWLGSRQADSSLDTNNGRPTRQEIPTRTKTHDTAVGDD